MPLIDSKLKSEMKSRIYNSLVAQFSADVSIANGYTGIANIAWMKLADAISDAAIDIVNDIHNDAQVLPGIPTPIGPTTGPGKIE